MDRLNEGALEALCSRLVRECDVDLPLDPWQLCASLAVQRQRPIRVLGAALGGPHSVGHLIAQPHGDTILYDDSAPRGVQMQIICHEVIHLVRAHLDSEGELTCGALLLGPTAGAAPKDLVGVDPDGEPNLYVDWQEWEAEVGATFLTGMATARPTPKRPPRSTDEAGFAAAFGLDEAQA